MDRFHVIERLGQGGAGTVWRVQDRVFGGAPLALKIVESEPSDILLRAFEREFVVLSNLSVPGVARVFDFGIRRGDTPRVFFTRTLVPGCTLDLWWPTRDITSQARMMAHIARTLAPLHRMGVAHGDIKPTNIVVDPREIPYLIDFGLATTSMESRGSLARAGTLAFLAPERLAGTSPTRESDIYALGASLWFLITGKPPALEASLLKAQPKIPQGIVGVHRDILEIARRALEPKPDKRLPSVSEFATALEVAIASPPSHRPYFVMPKPRGQEELLRTLENITTSPLSASNRRVCIVGASGFGKTTLLRAFKWRLQVRGAWILESRANLGSGLAPVIALSNQAHVCLDEEFVSPEASKADIVRDYVRVIERTSSKGPLFILVDDWDEIESETRNLILASLSARSAHKIFLVVTMKVLENEHGGEDVVQIHRLSRENTQRLVSDALGPTDPSVSEALFERTQGVPHEVVECLAALFSLGAPTADDIRNFPQSNRSTALLRSSLEGLSNPQRTILDALSLFRLPVARDWFETTSESLHADIDALWSMGLVVDGPSGIALSSESLRLFLREQLGSKRMAKFADRLFRRCEKTAPDVAVAELMLASQEHRELKDILFRATNILVQWSANQSAVSLLESALPRLQDSTKREATLRLAELSCALGQYAKCSEYSGEIFRNSDATLDEKAEAALLQSRSCVAMGLYDAAKSKLEDVPARAAQSLRARAWCEKARISLRRGEVDGVAEAVQTGLRLTEEKDPLRIELWASAGVAASYRGDLVEAKSQYQAALQLARELGARRDEANALTYLAIASHREGDAGAAQELYEQALRISRELGDVGSIATNSLNLGTIFQELGQRGLAVQHYESAARLARRLGRASTWILAQNNLASLYAYTGLYVQARHEAEAAFREAETLQHHSSAAQAIAVLADVSLREGKMDEALTQYTEALERYRKLGQRREVVEMLLDSTEVLLDRASASDMLEASARIHEASSMMEADGLRDLEPQSLLLRARFEMAQGETSAAASLLKRARQLSIANHNVDMEWKLEALGNALHLKLNNRFMARRCAVRAVEILETIAAELPTEMRDAFWQDERRRSLRKAALQEAANEESASNGKREEDLPHSRLLEIIKRLASERDMERLLERIMDSAIELSGAERGVILLRGTTGTLVPHMIRNSGMQPNDPHVSFSQSIAEAVMIDGEPIITVDARNDSRLQDYASVHELMLKSVACLPIRGRNGILGVLYLEHRVRQGRFLGADMSVLLSFTDQAAIALENAELIAENERRRNELQSKNDELQRARTEIEMLLVARTEELEEVNRELREARNQLQNTHSRHGMVGRTDSMMRVFSMIDRVAQTNVPVLIRGESGTGKELVARAIHYGSARAKAPFVSINCAALSQSILESELFGHVRGAFTGADKDRRGVLLQATGGTLLLDEVGDMPMKMQVELLRVLQDGKVKPVGSDQEFSVDVRVVAATNRPLPELIEKGLFREDLYYRLHVVEILLPALRARRDDIPLLCEHFLRTYSESHGVRAKKLTKDALDVLFSYSFPGNVRQLGHILLNACVLAEGDAIKASDLHIPDLRAMDSDEKLRGKSKPIAALPSQDSPTTLREYRGAEKQRILDALEKHGWNRGKAAAALGLPRRTFYRRLRAHGILS